MISQTKNPHFKTYSKRGPRESLHTLGPQTRHVNINIETPCASMTKPSLSFPMLQMNTSILGHHDKKVSSPEHRRGWKLTRKMGSDIGSSMKGQAEDL